MRPGGDPLQGLRRGVTEAAERMGLSPDARASLRRRLTLDDANEAAYALRCDLPAGATETLLIVDQFDELLTETPEVGRAPFINFLLKLAAMRGRRANSQSDARCKARARRLAEAISRSDAKA